MFTLNCTGRLLIIDEPVVMGILNTTPDSFFAASRVNSTDAVLQRAGQMLAEGAAILDVGGQSTRPGAELLSEVQEAERVLPAIRAISTRFPEAFISVDTYFASVASRAVDAGASLVNDISGGNFDPAMLPTVAGLRVPFICMHRRGSATTLHRPQSYAKLSLEVLDYFIFQTEKCRQQGIKDILLDPGFGFGKNADQNFELLRDLSVFSQLEMPLLIGVSRKSTIYKTLGITAEESLNGTTVLQTLALLNGADILRVHDVRPAVEAITLLQHYRKKKSRVPDTGLL
jgi:dihydropteroate synthase